MGARKDRWWHRVASHTVGQWETQHLGSAANIRLFLLEHLKYWIRDDDAKYFLRAKTINSTVKPEHFQPYFSIMWVFGFFLRTFPVNCTLLVHRSKQQPKADDEHYSFRCLSFKNISPSNITEFPQPNWAPYVCHIYSLGSCYSYSPPTNIVSHVWVTQGFIKSSKWNQIFFFPMWLSNKNHCSW